MPECCLLLQSYWRSAACPPWLGYCVLLRRRWGMRARRRCPAMGERWQSSPVLGYVSLSKPRREPEMQIGFNLPISGPMSSPENLARIAQQGEALGYDSLTLTDHIVLPNLRVPGYPYSESGEFFGEGPERRHEQLTAAAFIAAKTTRIRLVLAVMVVPHRPAVLTAKMLATIDVLSGGRLIVGVGAGWLKEEFEALGTPPFEERGAVTDEYMLAFRELWTKDSPRFDGRFVKFNDVVFAPKPVQKPCPPMWVGGESG